MSKQKRLYLYILIPFLVWLVGFGYNFYMSSQFGELDTSIAATDVTLAMNLELVEDLSDENIILYDEFRKLVFIYDYNGDLVNKIKFHHTGSVEVIDYTEGNLTAFHWRTYMYYIIDADGVIIDSYIGDAPDNIPRTSKCTSDKEICSKNYLLFHNLDVNDNEVFVSASFVPFILVSLSMLIMAVRLNMNIQMKKAEEIM